MGFRGLNQWLASPASQEPASSRSATPIVKWAGGKTRLLPELLQRMPRGFGTYYEPFAGGLALFFKLGPQGAVVGDMNHDLITLYSMVKLNVEGVIRILEQHAANHCSNYYYAERDRWNEWTPGSTSPTERAASFIYLNKTCFNGLWRVNRDGEFNVPMGAYKNPRICDADGLRRASHLLANAVLHFDRYENTVDEATAGDFVYFDPPYDGTFTAYTGNSFGQDDQLSVAKTARELVARGVQVMLSNSDTPFVRALYQGFRIDVVKCGRAINSDGAKRGAVNELVITGGYEIAS